VAKSVLVSSICLDLTRILFQSLLLLALLGEADILAGQVLCPRSPPNAIPFREDEDVIGENWLQPCCAYVPQSAWLQNASVRDNILFGLPMDEERYVQTLEACSLRGDLSILEDGVCYHLLSMLLDI
jgi:ABC-type multidrug transport system fused ATPase/permease subunit